MKGASQRVRFGLLLISTWVFSFAGGCASEGTNLNKKGIPTGILRSEDCEVGTAAYRQRLQLSPNAGVVVTAHPYEPPPPEVQEQAVTAFVNRCHTDLVGHIGRAVLRCWLDSTDTSSFNRCAERF